jgi:hypothetical protein
MSKMKRILAAVLLTAVIVADACHFGGIPTADGVEEATIIKIPKIVDGSKVYDEDGRFTGCTTGGSGCTMIILESCEISISDEGVHMR